MITTIRHYLADLHDVNCIVEVTLTNGIKVTGPVMDVPDDLTVIAPLSADAQPRSGHWLFDDDMIIRTNDIITARMHPLTHTREKQERLQARRAEAGRA